MMMNIMPALLTRLAVLALLTVACTGRAAAQQPQEEFQVGDRILLRVEGDSSLSDTFAVSRGPALVLPVIGELPLVGVRRADVEPYLARQLGRFLREPVVHARALLRLSILGEVEKPGFYAVPADAALTDALMAAGGPTRGAKFSALRIERDGRRIWQGEVLQQAIARGQTVDQMGLRGGDRVLVPGRGAETTMRILGILAAIPAMVYGIVAIAK
jgi:polysaccharide export outer membrane protein